MEFLLVSIGVMETNGARARVRACVRVCVCVCVCKFILPAHTMSEYFYIIFGDRYYESIIIYVKDGRGAGGNRQQSLLYMKNKTRPCNNNTGVTTYINIHTYTILHLYHQSK